MLEQSLLAALEDLFEIYFTWQGIPYEDTEFSGRSDYQEFINQGIPASGLFTGAEGVKTAAQQAIWVASRVSSTTSATTWRATRSTTRTRRRSA